MAPHIAKGACHIYHQISEQDLKKIASKVCTVGGHSFPVRLTTSMIRVFQEYLAADQSGRHIKHRFPKSRLGRISGTTCDDVNRIKVGLGFLS